MESIRTSGEARVSRIADGELTETMITLDSLLTAREALVRVGSLKGGESHSREFRHPVSLWTLREIDSMIEAIAYANRPITPLFKDASVSRSSDAYPPPMGYQWCPECLGCLERSQTCSTCDGDRAVKNEA